MHQSSPIKTIHQFSEEEPAFTEGSLRWLIFNEEKNGAKEAEVFPKLGRRRFVNKPKFFMWFDSQQKTA